MRGIIMDKESMAALWSDRKTQTRRKMHQPQVLRSMPAITIEALAKVEFEAAYPDKSGHWVFWENDGPKLDEFTKGAYTDEGVACPYGKEGDLLWVRERFRFYPQDPHQIEYEDGHRVALTQEQEDACERMQIKNWKAAMFMPRALSRLTLTVVRSRPQILQEISYPDIMAEGCPYEDGATPTSARRWFQHRWNSMHGRWQTVRIKGKLSHYECYPWCADDTPSLPRTTVPCISFPNPWVWAVTVSRAI